MLFDGIGAALIFNFKRLKREDFDELKSKINWSMVESFPFPASFEEQQYIGDEGKIHVYSWNGRQETNLVGPSFEEQQYIGDEGKIHVYSWNGRQETNLVGPYSVRDLYLEHFGK